jgi:hypothetical protein
MLAYRVNDRGVQMHTIIGVFANPRLAQRATEMLSDSGLKLGDLVIISGSTVERATVRHTNTISLGNGAAMGVAWGSLVGFGWMALSGIGPFIAAGALTVMAGALIGPVTGALMGGLVAALTQTGDRSRSKRQNYTGLADPNKTLVAVQVRAGDARRAGLTLAKAGAESVRAGETHAPAEL